jgi:two-component system, OmpR family, sensor histidine kinase TctE
MLFMIVVDTTILYRVAFHFIQKSFDYALLDSANDISELIKTSKTPIDEFKLSAETHNVILSDKLDLVYYSVYDQSHDYLIGDRSLPLMINNAQLKRGSYYSKFLINSNPIRVVTLVTTLNNNNGESIYVQVAETLNKRHRLAGQILLGLALPQLLLLFGAITMFSFGIKRGLAPLDALNSAILTRSHRDLSSIQLTKVPNEVSGLVKSINSLMNQLKNVLEIQNRFVADAAHQLKTPLAGIQAQLELAESETDEKKRQSNIVKVNHSMSKLSHMISQLLKLAQNQPETFNAIQMKVVNIGELSRNLCAEMVPAAYKKNIDLGFEMSDEDISHLEILGDYQRLHIMLQSLIDNAILYTPTGGKITVYAQKIVDHVVLSIVDSGVGIPIYEREKVFERFHRVLDNNYQEGSGLGLAIVKEIVLSHDAHVHIETPESGIGTRFVITFPPLTG